MTERDLSDIETYIEAARQHGEDDDPGHEVGDLQDMLRAAWELMAPEQKQALIRSPACQLCLQLGSYDDYGDPGAEDIPGEIPC